MPAIPRPCQSLAGCTDEDPSDEALIICAARGETEVQRAFVRRFQHLAYGLAQAIVGDPVQAEDIAQEALVQAWRQAGSFDPHRGPASKWLLRLTRDLAVDAVRRERLEPLEQRVVISLDERGRRRPSESARWAEKSHRVRTALRQVPAVERRALILATLYGYAAKDISEADGIPLTEARNRLRSGLTKLRDLLPQVEPVQLATESCL